MTTLVKEKIKDEEKEKYLEIILKMKECGFSSVFIFDAFTSALENEGILDLIKLWNNETDESEQNEIIADIQDLINDCKIDQKIISHINLNDLDTISNNIRQFKDILLEVVNENGGLKSLSEKTGIPQASLSRFFNTESMPQRATLLKIQKALGIKRIDLDPAWV
jgi:DNA-binding phage protein